MTSILIGRRAFLAALGGGLLFLASPAAAAEMTVWKSPSCGCCGAWVEHIRAAGFKVVVRDVEDVTPIKRANGVTPELASCHTAVIDGYVVEGHVPADSLKRLLAKRPAVKGIAVPGMPMGSPGMEGPGKDAYEVVVFDDEGRATLWEKR
ncbi:MAG: DUF411 domain-containing protein [Alphaproteobacteria bacterium]|nr:DUF411 domain-containing protein [Alphaproteobacteria bacterium]